MSNKIWNFDILVDDCFVNFNTKKQEINPDHNDRLLSVANGFEDGSWRYRQFKEFVFSNIAETALSAQEREKLIDNDYPSYRARRATYRCKRRSSRSRERLRTPPKFHRAPTGHEPDRAGRATQRPPSEALFST